MHTYVCIDIYAYIKRTAWGCYGPAPPAALPEPAFVVIHGLQARPMLYDIMLSYTVLYYMML